MPLQNGEGGAPRRVRSARLAANSFASGMESGTLFSALPENKNSASVFVAQALACVLK